MINKLLTRMQMLGWVLTKGSLVMLSYDVYEDDSSDIDILGSTNYSPEYDARMIKEVGTALVDNL